MWGQQLRSHLCSLRITPQAFSARICLCTTLHAYTCSSIRMLACPSVSLHCSNNYYRYWNINQLSISYALSLEAFLDSVGSTTSLASLLTPHHASGFQCTDLPMHHPTRLHMLFHSHACLPFCVTPLLKQLLPVLEYQPVVHLLRSLPRIRSRLTLRRRSLLRNPYAFGG